MKIHPVFVSLFGVFLLTSAGMLLHLIYSLYERIGPQSFVLFPLLISFIGFLWVYGTGFMVIGLVDCIDDLN